VAFPDTCDIIGKESIPQKAAKVNFFIVLNTLTSGKVNIFLKRFAIFAIRILLKNYIRIFVFGFSE
jgi:hypothetical protein